jgi:hypothetical protein
MSKTPEEIAFEWWAEYSKDKDLNKWDTVEPIKVFMAGYDAGYARGVEATHLIYDAVREHLERQMFPMIHHEPLLIKYTKGKDE